MKNVSHTSFTWDKKLEFNWTTSGQSSLYIEVSYSIFSDTNYDGPAAFSFFILLIDTLVMFLSTKQ